MKKIILASLLFSLTTLVNAAPTGVTLTSTVINENSAAVTTIGTATATGGTAPYSYDVIDPDKITFSFGVERQDGSINDNSFKVRPINGNTNGNDDITIAEIVDLSYGGVFGPAGILATAINTYNTNNGSGFTASIGENGDDSGTLILTAWPPDLYGAELIGFDTSGNKAAITITSANKTIPTATSVTSDFFSIDANGVLKSKVAFNHEEKASYAIVIRATDNDGSYSKDFTIAIINLPDTPTDIISNTTTLSIQENNSIGDIIGTFSTVDGNDGNHTYTLTGAANNLFSIDNNGVLTADVVFDFEERQSYTVTINTDDGTAFHATYSKNFTIIIINVADTPTDITLSPTTVAENNAIGTTVGMLATLGGTGPYSYTIEKNYKTFTFNVGEEDTDAVANNTFIVRAIGGTKINIVGDNFEYYAQADSPPLLLPANRLVNAINNQNSTGFSAISTVNNTSTGTVQFTDWPDEYDGAELIGFTSTVNAVAIDYITIESGLTLPTNPAPFSIDGNKLITTAVFDQATQGSYTITISSTDANNTVISKDFTITVVDGPSGTVTGITLAPNTINNQAADGTTVGFLSTNATDTGRVYVLENNTATFSISGDKLTANNPGSFTIVGATYTVYVSTLNGDNTIFTQSLTITVTNDPIFSLDVDGNGTINAPNDGLIIFKYLLNSNANNLHTTIASDTPDGRKTTPQLKAYLDDAGTILDVDGNGTINAPNDGLIIFKYLLNSNANNLHTTIASDAPDGKKTTPQLKAYLDLYSE